MNNEMSQRNLVSQCNIFFSYFKVDQHFLPEAQDYSQSEALLYEGGMTPFIIVYLENINIC